MHLALQLSAMKTLALLLTMIPWVNEKALSLLIEDGKKENQIEVFQKEKNNQKKFSSVPRCAIGTESNSSAATAEAATTAAVVSKNKQS